MQGKVFLNESYTIIRQYYEEGICTIQHETSFRDSYTDYTFSEYNERLSDLARSPEFYSPRF